MIRIKLKGWLVVAMTALYACGHAEKQIQKDVAIASENFVTAPSQDAFPDFLLDSVTVESFIEKRRVSNKRATQLREFYERRDYQFAWFNKDGLAQQVRSFWNLHNRYLNYAKDSSFYDQQLHRKMEALLTDEETNSRDHNLTELELQITEHFLDYAQYAYAGKVDPGKLQWHIPRKKINAIALLDSMVKRNGRQLDEWEPVNQQYKLVRKELLRLHSLQKLGGWPSVEARKKAYRIGDSSHAIQQLKQRLYLSGDYRSEERSPVFNSRLKVAVKRAQDRFGLKQDGVVGAKTLHELNKPVETRIEQLLVNMERMRWMPAAGNGKRLVANIPAFKLHVYEGNKEMFQMRIVVGKAANKTVVFSDQLKYVVFSPYWNVPRSIVRKEILPAMNRNPNYLARQNMEQTGTSGGLPVIRQKPGSNNALGRVKFLFPNSFNIYFHDTPAKSLFDRQHRAFSHGCIRLAEPKRLAAYLLQDRKEWTEQKIIEAMQAGTEKWVTLKEPVPVEITYFTAWVDNGGLLHFREDIYGHDKELAEHLFSN